MNPGAMDPGPAPRDEVVNVLECAVCGAQWMVDGRVLRDHRPDCPHRPRPAETFQQRALRRGRETEEREKSTSGMQWTQEQRDEMRAVGDGPKLVNVIGKLRGAFDQAEETPPAPPSFFAPVRFGKTAAMRKLLEERTEKCGERWFISDGRGGFVSIDGTDVVKPPEFKVLAIDEASPFRPASSHVSGPEPGDDQTHDGRHNLGRGTSDDIDLDLAEVRDMALKRAIESLGGSATWANGRDEILKRAKAFEDYLLGPRHATTGP